MIKFSDRFKNLSQISNDISSLDSGFESLLNLTNDDDDDDDSFILNSPSKSPRLTFEQKSPQHSSPGTPLKQFQSFQTPIKLTPIKKQVADVNGIYYSCIKSPLKSPQNYFNTDQYIRERDTHTANLLRSPAFKTQFIIETPVKKIKCKDFKQNEEDEVVIRTKTEEEFLQLLFKNNHLASNPECIIGRCMGLDNYDILSELNKRSMNNVLDVIMNNLNASDYLQINNVSKSWREIIQQDKKRNRARINYFKYKKNFYQSSKENISSPGFIKEKLNQNKRKHSSISSVFNELDINCLNNTTNYDLNSTVNNSAHSSIKLSYDEYDSLIQNYFDHEKMVINDLINQRHYNNRSFVSPQQTTLSQLEELKNKRIFSEPTIMPSTCNNNKLMNSSKICSKTSRKNLKRL